MHNLQRYGPSVGTASIATILMIIASVIRGQEAPKPLSLGPMLAAEQSVLVKRNCVVCHNDSKITAGLSFSKFDPANPDPTIAALMAFKIENGAMGAAGLEKLDALTTARFLSALTSEGAEAKTASGGWVFQDVWNSSTRTSYVIASMARVAPSASIPGKSDEYRLSVSCRKDIPGTSPQRFLVGASGNPAEIRLEAFAAAKPSLPLSIEVDGSPLKMDTTYTAEGSTGSAHFTIPLPLYTLSIRNLAPGETATFPFAAWTPAVRQILSTCTQTQGSQTSSEILR